MPTRLPARCVADSIREFRAAAQRRYQEGMSLAAAGQRTAAIYLWGYTAEMTLKAAYFSLIGLPEHAPITWGNHLVPAINAGLALNISWPNQGKGHNVRAWSELLVLTRAANSTTAYSAAFARDVQRSGQQIGQLWNETLRYHKNVAYLHEVRQVRVATEWFLVNSQSL